MPTKKKTAPKRTEETPTIAPGSVLIVRLEKGKTIPKPPPQVQVWAMDGDQMILTPQDLHARGWVRRKS